MRMHVFDMDGTLMEGNACLEISKAVGALEETLVIEADWVGGEINDVGFWNRCLPLWEGITPAQIDQAFADSPWLRGVSKVLADIKQRDEISVVISQSPEWFVERICRWGLDHAFGAGVTPGDRTGSARLVTSADKVSITNRLLSSTGISEANCIAYGDSSSDLELFKHLDNTVAINAKPHIRTLASAAYDGDDLFAAYQLGRELMDGRPSIEELQRRTLTAFSAAWDAGDVDTLLSLMSDNPVYRGSTGPEAGTKFEGREAVAAAFTRMIGPTPASTSAASDALSVPPTMYFFGDHALVHWCLKFPNPDGEPCDVDGVDVMTFDQDGRIVEKNAFRKAFA